jgi:hypothetical protein
MAFSIRLTEQEKKLAESYAKLHSLSLGEAFKKALFDKIDEEFDVAVYDEAYKEYEKSGKKSRPIAELWKELNL